MFRNISEEKTYLAGQQYQPLPLANSMFKGKGELKQTHPRFQEVAEKTGEYG